MSFIFEKRLKRTVRALSLALVALSTTQAHAITHRTSMYHPLGGTGHARDLASPLPSLYWQSAFNTQTAAVVLIPTSTPRPVSTVSVEMPEPGTFYAKDTQGTATLFDMGSQWDYDAWVTVAPPKALPNVQPGFATAALMAQTGADGLPLPVALPAGPKVKPKNWRSNMITNAKTYLGIPYVWGGNSPTQGMDCSGFVRWVVAMTLGKALPRLASQQSQVGTEVPKDELQPGDLVFFDTNRGPATHVGIYVGRGVFINAPHTGAKIRFESLSSDYWEARWHGARRVG
ncbi:C40 family peptidase [Burkholderia vietnamiensis]|uniref:C40 family peptidase n=1 Tax=Burkholderia vietnamiensis TaxID=60552 RepID=UPI001CF1228D|nr:C40 family peptidase [Burkholderia vietnamiensis]MCA8448840.1 C40 family peptidase [Burkholderia vietnamiensis]